MKKMIFLASALLLNGCGGEPPPKLTILSNSDWVLTGFESTVGVNSIPKRYFTLSFSSDTQLRGAIGCREFKGEYSQKDTLVTIKSTDDTVNPSCTKEVEDADYIAQLNSAKTFSTSDNTLALNLPDGRRLNFVKKFALCTKPLAVSGSDNGKIEITTTSQPIADLIALYEKNKPDFVIVSAGSCANSVVASVNPNTLAELRCNSAVTGLVYK